MSKIKSYQQANEYLGPKKERPFAHNTRIERDVLDMGHDVIVAKYHGNIVASFYPDGTNVYTSAGWKTVTTKERINWFLPDGFRLYQDHSTWFISASHWGDEQEGLVIDGRYTFADGIAIKAGQVYNAAPENEEENIRKQIKKIKKYVDGFIKDLLNGKVESPSGGDCWYCYMVTKDGESLGDAIKNTDHIESHIEESYYVPSLLYRAIEKTGRASLMTKDGIARLWQGESISEWQQSIVEHDVKACLTAYIKHELGLAQ